MSPPPTLDIEELERLREKLVSGHYVTAKAEYEGALHRAAPALIAAARERDRLKAALDVVEGPLAPEMVQWAEQLHEIADTSPTLDIEELERAAGRLLNAQDNLEPDYRWGHAYVHEHKADPHGGDCTDMPWTCSRCVCDDAIREAKAVGAPMLAEITRLREALKAAEEERDALERHYNAVCKALGHWRGRSSPASETARKMREALKAAEEALLALLSKLDAVHSATIGIFQIAAVHGTRYTGPNWVSEAAYAESCLALICSALGTDGEGK